MSTCQRWRGMVRLVLTSLRPTPGAGGSSWEEGPSDHYAVDLVHFILLKSERVQWNGCGCGCWRGW